MLWKAAVVASVLGFTGFLAGCIGFSGPVPYDVVEEGGQTGFKDNQTQLRVVTSEDEWEEFWRQHQENRLPPAARPDVDFSDAFVAAVFLGQRPSGGYALNVTQVVVEDGVYRIHYESSSPGQGCGTAAVITHPYVILTLSRQEGVGTEVALEFEGDKPYSC
jgi:hypothetical protein